MAGKPGLIWISVSKNTVVEEEERRIQEISDLTEFLLSFLRSDGEPRLRCRPGEGVSAR